MKRMINYFLKGLLVFIPAALTIFTIVLVFTKLDGLLKIPVPGLGLVITGVPLGHRFAGADPDTAGLLHGGRL
jgi:uncharacterized membrane protein